jgi:hydroxymethylbilane synthase
MPQSSQPRIRLGTRASRLARTQTDMARAALETLGGACEVVTLTTSGDRFQSAPLADAGGKGLFTKELEEALLAGTIDLAVHSMKDVPAFLPKGLMLAAFLPRADPRDAFLSAKAPSLAALPPGARVGTSSVRRTAQLARLRPDLQSVLLRGNVDTRLAKLDAGGFDAAILACAGLQRLGLSNRITAVLEPADWPGAPAQGAIGIEVRTGDANTRHWVEKLNHSPTAITIACERAFLAALDGSCRTPIGALATLDGATLRFHGEILAPDGSDHAEACFEATLSGDVSEHAALLGREAGLSLRPRAAPWLDL